MSYYLSSCPKKIIYSMSPYFMDVDYFSWVGGEDCRIPTFMFICDFFKGLLRHRCKFKGKLPF